MSIVPLPVRFENVEFARRHHKGAAQLERREVLADAVLGAELKGAISGLGRVEGVVGTRGGQPALGQEFVGASPVGRVAVQGLMDDPDEGAVGGIAAAVGVDDVDIGRPLPQRRGGREEPQGFFDHAVRVRDLVEQMWGFDYGALGAVQVGPEYGVVLGPD